MEDFTRLFGSLLSLVYHCFDRIVILGHLPLLTRPENIVHFFRDVHGVGAITKEVLRQRTIEYNQWVEAFARNHHIPIEWAEKGVRKEDYVRPRLRQMERRQHFGVYFILKSMEVGTNFRVAMPKYPTADPDYRIVSRQRSRFTHYYFYIRDQVLGPQHIDFEISGVDIELFVGSEGETRILAFRVGGFADDNVGGGFDLEHGRDQEL